MATRKECLQALQQHENELSKYANVVGMGVVSQDEQRIDSPESAVAVYVSKKIEASKLPKKDLLPKQLAFKRAKGEQSVPVRVIEQGQPELESQGKKPPSGKSLGKEPL